MSGHWFIQMHLRKNALLNGLWDFMRCSRESLLKITVEVYGALFALGILIT